MIPKECKRLIEVDFPIAAISDAVLGSEKRFPVPRGVPSTLHHWWARRPTGACRAVLLGLLLPDPGDPRCPHGFKETASKVLGGLADPPKTDKELREALLDFISRFSLWENASHASYIGAAVAMVRAANPEETPVVVDTFAGGGAIPLEALRLGCETFAGELNPVACLLLKVMLEDIPNGGPRLVEDLKRAAREIMARSESVLSEFYPAGPDGARPIAYVWARTVRCEAPNCGAEIPLLRSFWLSKKADRRLALRYHTVPSAKGSPGIDFELFEPERESDVPKGTVGRAKAKCLCCPATLPPDRVRAQLVSQRGGGEVAFDNRGRRTGGARLLAVVGQRPGERGRLYRLPTERDYEAVWRAQQRLEAILEEWERGGKHGLCPVPDEPLPPIGTLGFRVQRYGMLQWGDLFTARQKLGLITLAREIAARFEKGASEARVAELLALALDKVADFNCSLAHWRASNEDIGDLFARQALPMVWDFAETSMIPPSYVEFERAVDHVVEVVEHIARSIKTGGQFQLAEACRCALPDESATIFFTDPPYYDAVPYADLSDFFFVWLKRALPRHPLLRDPFEVRNALTPKTHEIVQDETKHWNDRPKDREFFESRMAEAFSEGRRVLRENGIGCVIFAHKTTEGWEALLSGLIRGGWTITASWPIYTEMGSRLRARESAALATSIHLICRPRPATAAIGDWSKVLEELPRRVRQWITRLEVEGIRGADLVFACIGPALEIFSRYSKVETAEGREVDLAEYLEKVWEVVGRSALDQVLGRAEGGEAAPAVALEEDARLTALFLWTLQSTQVAANGEESPGDEPGDDEEEEDEGGGKPKKGGYALPFDIVRRFAQPLGIHLDAWEGRLIETKKGIVRLLPLPERASAIFGGKGAEAVAEGGERLRRGPVQTKLFPEPAAPRIRGGRPKVKGLTDVPSSVQGMTTLDRVHAAMLLQAGGQSGALREFLDAEIRRGPGFLRLANALSALYPRESEEKRLIDAVLLALPRR